jgi:glycosyltransferase involved in cell wall biosynthesis
LEKKLIYVVSQVVQGDSTHLYHVLNLLGVLRRRGWGIRLISERGGVGTKAVSGENVTFLAQRGHVLRGLRFVWLLLDLRVRGYRLVFVRISRLAALIAIAIGRCVGMRVVYWHSGATRDIDRSKPLWKRLIDDFSFSLIRRGVHVFVTGPESMLEYYATQYSVPRSKLRLLYNDIDVSRFRPTDTTRTGGPVTVLFVHRFSPVRQTSLYMPAIIDCLNVAALEGIAVELQLIGDGPDRKVLEDAAGKAHDGVNVRFLGAQPNVELPSWYQQADIFIMPTYREGFPRVVVEAMASGVPIVTTDAGGTRDVLGPLQQRFVVSKDDPIAFGDRLLELIRSSEIRKRLADENAAHVKKYSTESVAEMFEQVLLGPTANPCPAS